MGGQLAPDWSGHVHQNLHSVERFVYANNNFHKNCLTNRLKIFYNGVVAKKTARQKDKVRTKPRDSFKSTRFEVLKVNAVKDIKTFEPEWPEKTSAAYWREKFEEMSFRSFMREYMNTHVSEGKIFKHEHIQFKRMLPLREYDALVFYGDLSYKDAGDYKSLVLVGKAGHEFHVIFIFLRQKSRAKAAKWLYDLYEEHKLHKYNIKYKIEGLFAQDEFVNDFDAEGDSRGYRIPVRADKRGKEGKYDRIESMDGDFERLWFFFNILLENDPDMIELVDQFLEFEKGSAKNDDGPDSVQGAKSLLSKRSKKKKHDYAHGGQTDRRY